MGKNYRKITEKLQKLQTFGVILPLFWGNFPHFRGLDRGGEFCDFSPFFGDFRPDGLPGPLRGKTTRKTRTLKVSSNYFQSKLLTLTLFKFSDLQAYFPECKLFFFHRVGQCAPLIPDSLCQSDLRNLQNLHLHLGNFLELFLLDVFLTLTVLTAGFWGRGCDESLFSEKQVFQ